MTEYNLPHLGIEQTLEIEGELTEISVAAGLPIVFLIDEFHGHNESIAQNIANVQQLLEHANVRLIGVESHHVADMGMGDQCSDLVNPTFANHFNGNENAEVAGVESRELFDIMNDDTGGMPLADIAVYAVNYLRSYYYLMALFRHRRERGLNGNMVLNGGRNHIDHIRQLIAWGGAQQLAGIAASYIHIRATAYPPG